MNCCLIKYEKKHLSNNYNIKLNEIIKTKNFDEKYNDINIRILYGYCS